LAIAPLPDHYLDANEVAEILNCQQQFLYRTRYEGKPPGSLATRLGPRALRWNPTVLAAWIAEQEEPARQALADFLAGRTHRALNDYLAGR
jgi:predicted DNA-binding transcriptional regulator AlpA